MSCYKGLLLLLPLVFLVLCSNFGTIGAIRGHHRKTSKHHPPKHSSSRSRSPKPSPTPSYPPPWTGTEFNVMSFGAKGNGHIDDTKAFQAAWASACKVEGSTLEVPSGHTFLVGQVSFVGPCKPNIVFQLDGTIIAPTNPNAWGSGTLQWLQFKKLTQGITVQGHGLIEGRGSAWWTKSHLSSDQISNQLSGNMPKTRPAALRFYGSYNVIVTGITIQNSPKSHLKFDSCEGVHVFNISVSSPGDSPNTDGIHVENSVDVAIHHTDLRCGDDCISIQTGSSNVYIHDVNCGPGHGISIGGLGKYKTNACVSNVTVEHCTMSNTMTGVRIKTWQGGSGSAHNIKFSNIQLSAVKTAIDIDQFYCDASRCKNQSSAVALSEISYQSIRGTYTVRPVYLACSDSKPCLDISLTDIVLKAQSESSKNYDPFCWKAYGTLQSPTVPPIECLKSENQMKNVTGFTQYMC